MLTSLLLVAGCSGTVNHTGTGGGDPGGAGSVAGTGGSVAGTGGSGSGSGTGGAGIAGAGGAGGGLPTRCTLPQDIGPCDGAIPRYWHDPRTGVCVPFSYGGCEGNENRFESLEQCQEACQGGVPDMDACESLGDCILASPGCCAACDPVDARAFVALNRASVHDYQIATGCEGVACAPCPDVDESERSSQYFAATCEAGRCVVIDVRESTLTECAIASDCVLRDGLDCCEGCDGRGIVALNRSADLQGMVCPGNFGAACNPCLPVYPPGMTAVCSSGRCQPQMPATP
ncbi:BPTI/Kunitz domain-containing protein [Sorangium sp. So ce381]|uniref:BPTI/Kunitz domain-containing protein n=1 Tax=Sorangium sp. So ce381 TaxID=3133307 RepID=UPI003F5C82C0